MAHFMDLRAFILRAHVLKLYRQALRMTRRAPGNWEGKEWSRQLVVQVAAHHGIV
uniref:Uncharacterized protein n=1 Tax=Oryza glumipatula TaxID=40148 RepID=A0A0D9Z2C1_9ORYZ